MKKILFIGDIVGKKGRLAVRYHLPQLIKKYGLDFVIANGENATHGKGLIHHHYEYLLDSGVDCITLGNHYDAKSEIKDYIAGAPCLIRPINLKRDYPGVGTELFKNEDFSIRITNILGQAFMSEEVTNPFDALDKVIKQETKADIHIVDFHAEATGEKYALAYAFDGQISALIGTHTHVQTRDFRLLPNKTAYISDVGMTGPYYGILGVAKEPVIAKLWHQEKATFVLDNDPETVFSALLLSIDEHSGQAIDISPIYIVEKL